MRTIEIRVGKHWWYILDYELPYVPIFVWYSPAKRRACLGRQRLQNVIWGVFLFYYNENMEKMYTWGFDFDKALSMKTIKQIDRYLYKHYGYNVVMAFRTAKGTHVYTNIEERDRDKCYKIAHNVIKTFGGDKWQLKLGRFRAEAYDLWGVLRLGGKYVSKPGLTDIRPIYIEPKLMNEWHWYIAKAIAPWLRLPTLGRGVGVGVCHAKATAPSQ